MSTTVRYWYSDMDMLCPGLWYGGFKEGRVISFGSAERAMSNPSTGDWTGATFQIVLSDYDRSIRERLVSATDRYWTVKPITIRMVDRATRAALGIPHVVFVGPIIDAQPDGLTWNLTLGDSVSQGILSDEAQQPYRKVGDGVAHPDTMTIVDDSLDRDTPEPIIYGPHVRVPEVDVASPQGFCVLPTYLGRMDVSGNAKHVWLVAGHACADVPKLRVSDVGTATIQITSEGSDWLIPHHAAHTAQFGAPYNDYTDVFGKTRRYTLIFGTVTDIFADLSVMTTPDACALGHKQLTVEVHGIEDAGDGSGTEITDRLQQYKHFLINYVANRGSDSYHSGAWLDNPEWTLFDSSIPIVDEQSFNDATDVGIARLPPDGYLGSVVIGARSGERHSVRRWIADFNRSCSSRIGVTAFGQIRISLLHPTNAVKTAAPLITAANDILEGSFGTSVGWAEHFNRLPFKTDYDHGSGVWRTIDKAENTPAITLYGREILGEERDYPFAPGITMSNHLAQLELKLHTHPLRQIVFEGTIGPNADGSSLAILDLGDYLRYQHFASIGSSAAQIRLAQVVSHQVQVGARTVRIEAVDCEDFIGYDIPDEAILAFYAQPSETFAGDAAASMVAVDATDVNSAVFF